MLNKVTVGQIPQKNSKTVSFFLKNGGKDMCVVTGGYRRSAIVEQLDILLPKSEILNLWPSSVAVHIPVGVGPGWKPEDRFLAHLSRRLKVSL